MKDKFIVIIPIDTDKEEYKEVRFKTRKEITEFLQISMNSLDSMINHELKCILPKHHHLKGIKIKRIVEEKKENPIVYKLDPIEFRKQLLEKIK